MGNQSTGTLIAATSAVLGLFFGLLIPRPAIPDTSQLTDYLWAFVNAVNSYGVAAMVARAVLIGQCCIIFRFVQKRMQGGSYQCNIKSILPFHYLRPHAISESDDNQDSCSENQADQSWYITDEDLSFFIGRVEQQQVVLGASDWSTICEKEHGQSIKFQGNRRFLPNGKTEYLNYTYLANATAREVADFYLDDPSRPQWDGFITSFKVVENGRFENREQVVRWIRSFPMGFLSDREYVIARKEYELNGKIYAVSKATEHVSAPQVEGLVRTETYWSMWTCENVPCPWGTSQPACKVTLLHHEQMKINENLARFAIKQGMWAVVKSIVPAFESFVAQRRTRTHPNEKDADAYGSGTNSGLEYLGVASSDTSSCAIGRSMSDGINVCEYRRKRMKKVASAVLLTCGFIVAVAQGSGGGQEPSSRWQQNKTKMLRSRTQSSLSRLT